MPGTVPAPAFPTTINLTKKSKPRTAHAERLEAARVARLKKKVKAIGSRSNIPEPLWVHVGNIDPKATEAKLAAHFAMCGTVQYVSIRYSSSGRPGNPADGYNYAIVKFKTQGSVRRADAANGSSLPGSQYRMIVSTELLTLPEVQNLPEFREVCAEDPILLNGIPQTQVARVAKPHRVHHTGAGALRFPIVCAPTVIWRP
ncbi:hypothetical protein C8R46DRAFT_1226731 [Mycena filopes]|nr:hypothetical protein C8R46DRAFT_1226731 [Mycena filopes]